MPYSKFNYSIDIPCANAACTNKITVTINGDPSSPDYGQRIVRHAKRKCCSKECNAIWQQSITWEERFGKDRAEEIRVAQSLRVAGDNNPSKDPEVAKKISKSLSYTLQKNPELRSGENNGFFGKKHSVEQKEKWSNDKRGKWPYTPEQKEKQSKNTPRREDHPNWNGGSSLAPYGIEFTKDLKEEIKLIYNHVCQLCGDQDGHLDVHHIDYNKLNNDISNLIPLCKPCHGRTNFDRDVWKSLFEDRKINKIML